MGWMLYECTLNLYQGFLFTYFIHKMLHGNSREPAAFWLCAVFTTLALSSYTFFPMPSWDTWIFVFLFLYAVFFFKDSLLRRLFWAVILLVVVTGITGISYHIFLLIYGTTADVILSSTLPRILFTIVGNGILTLVLLLIARLCQNQPEHSHSISALLVINLLCTALMDVFFTLAISYGLSYRWVFAGCGLTLLIGGLTIFIYWILSDFSTQIQNYQIQEKLLQTQNRQTEELQSMYTKMLRLQHDMNAYINDLKEVSSRNDQPADSEYLHLLEDRLHPLPSTGNPALDSVLSIKYFKMEEHHIEFRGSNLHYTGGMNISDVSLCSLISNMLDNALESLIRNYAQIDCPFVYLGFSYSALGLMIICENPVTAVEQTPLPRLLTSTKQLPGHGLGIPIMRKIIDDANGQIDFVQDTDLFRVLALIPIAGRQSI